MTLELKNNRILYFSSQFPNPSNPAMGVFSLQRVLALRKAGCEIEVVNPLLITPPPILITKPIRFIKWINHQTEQPDIALLDDLRVFYPKWLCPPKPVFGWYFSLFEEAQIRRTALRAASQLRPHVILSSWLPDGVVAARLGERLGLPVLCIADGSDVNEWPVKYPNWHYARDILNRNASALIYVSEALRRAGVSRGLHARHEGVVHNAVDTQVFKPDPDRQIDATYTILAVGRLNSVKGHHVLLDAYAEFTRQLDRPSQLILVGGGELEATLREQAHELGIASTVRFAGAVAPEQMPAYYQAADSLCLPSFSEGLPCVVVEAMACGIPVVASRVGGVPEVVDAQSGILVPPGDPQELCKAMLQAANRTWDAQAIRQKIVDDFSSTAWAEQVLELIQTVIANQMADKPVDKREIAWPA